MIPRTSGPATVIKQSSLGRAPSIQPANQAPGAVLPTPTAPMVQDPEELTRYIRSLVQQVQQALQAATQGVLTGANLVQNIAVTANQTTVIAHQLGRNIKGRVMTSYTFTSGTEDGVIRNATLPSPRSSMLYYAFVTKFTGTVDILFF